MHRDHALERFQRSLLRDALVERRNDPRVLLRRVDMAGRKELERVQPVAAQQHVVKFRLDLAVGHAAFPGELLHIRMAGAVQRKVAHKAQRIGQRGGTVVLGLYHAAGTVKEHAARLFVHGIAQRTHRVGLGSMVIKQQVRPVQADIVKLTVLFQLSTQIIRQMFQHIGTKAAVRIGRRHGRSLSFSPAGHTKRPPVFAFCSSIAESFPTFYPFTSDFGKKFELFCVFGQWAGRAAKKGTAICRQLCLFL